MPYDLRFSFADTDRSCPAEDQRFPMPCGPSADQDHELGRRVRSRRPPCCCAAAAGQGLLGSTVVDRE
jgi:hypothetical protein